MSDKVHGNKDRKHSEETKRKMSDSGIIAQNRPEVKRKKSEARKGEKNPMYGKPISEETRKKMSEALKKVWRP